MNSKPWLASYPEGVAWDHAIKPTSVQQILTDAVAGFPDRPAIDFMGKRLNYRELGALVDRAAKGLQALGVRPGVHVGLFLPNTPHYLVALFGVLQAGGTVVNYSPLDAAKVLEHKIEDSQTDFLITLDLAALYPQMAAMLGKTRLKKLIVGNLAEMTGAPEQVAAQMKAKNETVDISGDEHHLRFSELLDNDGRYTPHPLGDPREALAILQYTGGTTGLPKGAMLTHANLSSACEQVVITQSGTPPVLQMGTERLLAVLPPFHIYALTVNLLLGVRLAAEIVQHLRFDPKAALRDIAEKKLTTFCGVPTMFTAVIGDPDTPQYDLHSLKLCNSGGAPLPMEVGERFRAITGTWLAEGWGMTETSPTGTFSPAHGQRKAGSCGIPHPGVVIKMLDLEDPTRYVPLGEKGEMCIQGPNVMKGYWNKPEATADSTTLDGFFRTGDVGYMDEDGFVFIVDRCKDMLLCSGYNVYPRVLEEAIYQHPAVHEVAVIGVPDEYRGQSPKAFVTLKPGAEAFDIKALQSFLKERVGKHEMVQALEIRAALPKTAVGKLSKKDLVDEELRKQAVAAATA
ncbi:long-chain acyl-CoA synthetase [Variovorax boronicumulans]|uniref:Long-chain-fatty-acid--CoA ligase n=1 Tax=Variovorax boronicumulans TaxID=436515 RepID=A0AAW8E062_9BURK|nr:long-chain fatty acid--CoA ligase [Variovorax boronicumulans]MDP9879384.1 long-chain acyl-CoA synthetase [Variovorax boronicumulans]MDP9918519.1 long-chain acyl-CoA synthetase [Variovorax boronicumulans]MDP9924939.1 long-chain acyl-CoA synthetase [Variovorax boronicumulans]